MSEVRYKRDEDQAERYDRHWGELLQELRAQGGFFSLDALHLPHGGIAFRSGLMARLF